MNFVEKIKGKKVVTLDHWRYKMLHWFFRVDAETPEEAMDKGVPRHFYTHWCPLFWMTNGLAVFFPLIVLYRCIAPIVSAFVTACINFVGVIKDRKQRKIDKLSDEEKKAIDLQYLKGVVKEYFSKRKELCNDVSEEFDEFREDKLVGIFHSSELLYYTINLCGETSFDLANVLLDEEEFKEYFKQKYNLREKTLNAKQVKRENTDYGWWLNAMTAVAKTIGVVFWGLAFLLSATLAFLVAKIAWFGGVLMYNVFSFAVLFEVLKVCLFLMCVGVTVSVLFWFLSEYAPETRVCKGFVKGMQNVFGIVRGFFKSIGSGVDGFAEFWQDFYSNNCPPIEIIEGDE